MNDRKAIATILFRVLGVSDIVFAVAYWPYNLLVSHYTSSSGIIVATLCALVYLVIGLLLIILSKRLAALVVKGLDQD
jgi:uncharacterized metal-binding protein